MLLTFYAFFPVIVLFTYMCYSDRRQPEPVNELLLALLAGVASTTVSGFISGPFGSLGLYTNEPTNLLESFCVSFFGAGVPEEIAKFVCLYLIVRRNRRFDERFDGIVYAACVGLGFAGFENLLYVAQAGDEALQTAELRALLSVPGHFDFGVFMGYWFAKWWWEKKGKVRNLCLALLVPIATHTLYDTLCFYAGSISDNEAAVSALEIALYVLCIFLFLFMRNRVKKQLEADVASIDPLKGDGLAQVDQDMKLQIIDNRIFTKKQIFLALVLSGPWSAVLMISHNADVVNDLKNKNLVWLVGSISLSIALGIIMYGDFGFMDSMSRYLPLLAFLFIIPFASKIQRQTNADMPTMTVGKCFRKILLGVFLLLVQGIVLAFPKMADSIYEDSVGEQKYWTLNHEAEFEQAHDYNLKMVEEENSIRHMCYLACEYLDRETPEDSLKAQEWLDKAVENSDSSYVADDINSISYSYARKEQYEKALSLLNIALSYDDQQANIHDSVGEMLFNLGRKEEALEEWHKVLKLNPDFLEEIGETDFYMSLKNEGLLEEEE